MPLDMIILLLFIIITAVIMVIAIYRFRKLINETNENAAKVSEEEVQSYFEEDSQNSDIQIEEDNTNS